MSVDAVQLKLICDEETAVAVSPVGMVGSVVSVETAWVVADAEADCTELYPAASYADTV